MKEFREPSTKLGFDGSDDMAADGDIPKAKGRTNRLRRKSMNGKGEKDVEGGNGN